MQYLLLLIYAVVVPGFFLMLCGLLAAWLVFGRTHLTIRVPLFLLGTLPLGLTISLLEAKSGAVIIYFGCTALAVLSTVVLERHLLVTSVICFLIGLPAAISELLHGNLDVSWFPVTTLGLCGLAAVLSSLRLVGFRMVSFADNQTIQGIQLATGRDITEWITMLDDKGAASWRYAEIVIFLREFGFTYHWQKAITIIYEKSLGRRAIDRDSEGNAHPLLSANPWNPAEWAARLTEHRFTIEQMLLWSVAAACFFAFFRIFSRFDITEDHLVVGIPVVIGLAICSMLLLHQCLAVRNRLPGLIAVLMAIVGLSAILPTWISLYPGVMWAYFMMLTTLLGFSLWMTGALMVMRQRGFRLVQLHRSAERMYAADEG